jgi:hypothetical protein
MPEVVSPEKWIDPVSRKWPSIGFLYLLLAAGSFGVFFSWSVRVGWYERIHTSAKTMDDHVQWASYLEGLADDISGVSKKTAFYLDAAQLREWAGQPAQAIAVLEKGLYFLPDQSAIRSKLFELYERSGQKQKAVNLTHSLFSGGEQRRKTVFSLLVDAFGRDDPDFVNRLTEKSVSSLGDGRTIAIGFSNGMWTVDDEPGYLVVPGFPDKRVSQDLFLSCYAADRDLPIIVTVTGEKEKLVHVFQERGRVKVTLPSVAAGRNGLFKITTDKHWVPTSADNRKLGVRVQPTD